MPGSTVILEANVTLAYEPMMFVRQGFGTACVEDLYVVTAGGCERLSEAPKSDGSSRDGPASTTWRLVIGNLVSAGRRADTVAREGPETRWCLTGSMAGRGRLRGHCRIDTLALRTWGRWKTATR